MRHNSSSAEVNLWQNSIRAAEQTTLPTRTTQVSRWGKRMHTWEAQPSPIYSVGPHHPVCRWNWIIVPSWGSLSGEQRSESTLLFTRSHNLSGSRLCHPATFRFRLKGERKANCSETEVTVQSISPLKAGWLLTVTLKLKVSLWIFQWIPRAGWIVALFSFSLSRSRSRSSSLTAFAQGCTWIFANTSQLLLTHSVCVKPPCLQASMRSLMSFIVWSTVATDWRHHPHQKKNWFWLLLWLYQTSECRHQHHKHQVVCWYPPIATTKPQKVCPFHQHVLDKTLPQCLPWLQFILNETLRELQWGCLLGLTPGVAPCSKMFLEKCTIEHHPQIELFTPLCEAAVEPFRHNPFWECLPQRNMEGKELYSSAYFLSFQFFSFPWLLFNCIPWSQWRVQCLHLIPLTGCHRDKTTSSHHLVWLCFPLRQGFCCLLAGSDLCSTSALPPPVLWSHRSLLASPVPSLTKVSLFCVLSHLVGSIDFCAKRWCAAWIKEVSINLLPFAALTLTRTISSAQFLPTPVQPCFHVAVYWIVSSWSETSFPLAEYIGRGDRAECCWRRLLLFYSASHLLCTHCCCSSKAAVFVSYWFWFTSASVDRLFG